MADDNDRGITADPGMPRDQYNFGFNADPPDPDTKGCVPDPSDGYQGQTLDFQGIAPYEYPEHPAGHTSGQGLPMPLA